MVRPVPSPEELLTEMSWLEGFSRRLVADPVDAEDLLQDTLTAAVEHSPAGLSGRRLRGWLARVARNFAFRRMRDESLRRDHETRRAREDTQDSLDETERLQLQHALVGLVLELPDGYREPVLMRHRQELSYEHIARELGITQATARQRVSRGLDMLRRRMDERCGGRAAWSAVLVAAPPRAGSPLPLVVSGVVAAVAVAALAVGYFGRGEPARPVADGPPAPSSLDGFEPWLGFWRALPPFEDEGAMAFEWGIEGVSVRMLHFRLVRGAYEWAGQGLAGQRPGADAIAFLEFHRDDVRSFEAMSEGTWRLPDERTLIKEYTVFDPDGSSRRYREVYESVTADRAVRSSYYEGDDGHWVDFGRLELQKET